MLRLKDLREDKDLNQTQISKIIGISQSVYSKYERNEISIDKDSLKILALFYNTSIDYILGLTDIKEPYKRKKDITQ